MKNRRVKMEEFKSTDASILELIKFGTITREVKVNDKVTFYIKNLTQSDREKYSKLVQIEKPSKDGTVEESLIAVVEASKVPLLTYAITKINDVDFTSDSSKAELKKILEQLPSIVIDKLYSEYLDNEGKLVDTFNNEEVKKN